MDIQDIVALDKASRRKVKEATAKADEIDSQTPEKIQELRTRLEAETNEELACFEKEQQALVQTKVAQVEEQLQEIHARLDEKYGENKNAWVSHIVQRVTEV